MARIANPGLGWALAKKFPGWEPAPAGKVSGSLHWKRNGRKNVLDLQAAEKGTEGWALSRKLEVPAGKKARLSFTAGVSKVRGWELVVKADGKELLRKGVDRDSLRNDWMAVSVDWAGPASVVEISGRPQAPGEKALSLLADLVVTSE